MAEPKSPSASGGRLSVARLIAYGLPGLPIGALGVPLFIFLPTFYSQEVGLPLATVGAILLVARLWDVVTDPVIGALSDRSRSRFGRRRPWMLAAVPLLMLSVWMIFRPPEDAGAWHLLGWSLLLYLGWTMIQLPHGAWGAELSDDYDERSRIAGARESCVVIGTLLAAGTPVFLGIEGDVRPGAALGALALALMVVLPLTVGTAAAAVRDHRTAAPNPLPWTESRRLLLRNKPFLRLILAYLINGLANGLPATLFLLFVEHVLVAPERQGLLLFVYFLCGILGVPLWLLVARRLGKHRTWCTAMILNAAIFAIVPLLGAGDADVFLVICIATGLCLGADLTLPSAIQADVVDVDTAQGGGRRTGLYFAFWGMATKMALALAVGIAFGLLDVAGFDAAGTNGDGALLALALLYAGLPVLLKAVAIGLMWRFPLDRDAQGHLRAEILRKDGEVNQETDPCSTDSRM
ncbi:MFS transporter [Thalassobaculum sp. OXR-137]|uniref:MFS transporter n=1 Tax=Thalassobaculum sp. OXR-137 TaxID=3100173 RepID=UPI002AC91AE8|nr:MFS transporter [Thalassobaculum sp. OXR-137]WPZ36878.1 MFS transporter [Thalassobaculum sp. OXR-137]